MNGILKISVVVFTNSYNDRVNARHVTLHSKRCSVEEAREYAKDWINMNGERFNVNYLDIVFTPDSIDITID